MGACLVRLAYDGFADGQGLRAVGYAAIAVFAIALFLVDGARLRTVRRHAWLRWGVRAWWLVVLVPLAMVLVA